MQKMLVPFPSGLTQNGMFSFTESDDLVPELQVVFRS